MYDKYYELTVKYNKLSNTKKYELQDTYKNNRDLKNIIKTFSNLYNYNDNYIDYYNTIKPFYYIYNY